MNNKGHPDSVVGFRAVYYSRQPARLDSAVQELIEERIEPRQGKCEKLALLWSQILPAELSKHCKIVGICGGQLKVQVDSPSYMYELQICSSELIRELRGRRGLQIKEIKILPS